jgi:hypothetical protein
MNFLKNLACCIIGLIMILGISLLGIVVSALPILVALMLFKGCFYG